MSEVWCIGFAAVPRLSNGLAAWAIVAAFLPLYFTTCMVAWLLMPGGSGTVRGMVPLLAEPGTWVGDSTLSFPESNSASTLRGRSRRLV